MQIGRIAKLGKKVLDQRGGVEGVKKDAQELKEIAKGEGTVGDKAKRAAKAMREKPAETPPEDQQQV